ncbi:MAG: uracil-DNA glycosylase family protein [Planctomycetaceae bacterium]
MPAENSQRVRRAARQYLDSLSRAGLTHLPPVRVAASSEPAPVVSATAPSPVIPELRAVPPIRLAPDLPAAPHGLAAPPLSTELRTDTAAPNAAAPIAQSLFVADEDSPKDLPSVPRPTLSRSRDERISELTILSQRVAKCTRCHELATTRTQTVFGVGNPEAKVLFLGEAPGADEDKQGEPFVGRAGKLLNDIIAACRWKREEIYICNILRCRPPGNRNPAPEEASNCREYLDGQIAIVDPDYIVCWGSIAAQNLLDSKLSMGKLRGQFYKYGRAKVLCTYHPAYLLRNPPAKKDVWQDMKFLLRDMGVDLDAK